MLRLDKVADAAKPAYILEYARKVCRLIRLNGAEDKPALSKLVVR